MHAITIFPWLLGAFIVIAPVFLALSGHLAVATALLCLASVQYVRPVPAWPAFADTLKLMNPRAYYKQCSLGGSLKSVRDSKTLLSYHPHGMLTIGFSWNGCHAPEFNGKRIIWLVVDVLCQAPLFGWVVGWMGNIQGASARNMKQLMAAGTNVALLPGGLKKRQSSPSELKAFISRSERASSSTLYSTAIACTHATRLVNAIAS